jgi:glucose/mannose-6-phosphate isomerase
MTERDRELFRSQFTTDVTVERGHLLEHKQHTVVCGMGGSYLPALFIKRYGGMAEISTHRDYGLPKYLYDSILYRPEDTLVILSSYSGNTEEVLDAAAEGLVRGCALVAITTGGKLADFANTHNIPLVRIPVTGIEPRLALGFGMRAIAQALQDETLEQKIIEAGLHSSEYAFEEEAQKVSEFLLNKVPLIWSSSINTPLSYIWKVNFNETTKIPAFTDVCPELCHNDLCGFDVVDGTRSITESMGVIIMAGPSDHPRVQKKLSVASDMLLERGIGVYTLILPDTGFKKAFKTVL